MYRKILQKQTCVTFSQVIKYTTCLLLCEEVPYARQEMDKIENIF